MARFNVGDWVCEFRDGKLGRTGQVLSGQCVANGCGGYSYVVRLDFCSPERQELYRRGVPAPERTVLYLENPTAGAPCRLVAAPPLEQKISAVPGTVIHIDVAGTDRTITVKVDP